MAADPKSSEPLGEAALALLTACTRRGALTPQELAQLIPVLSNVETLVAAAQELIARGWLTTQGSALAVTSAGSAALDEIVERIERQLTPDSAGHEARYRRETPSLPFEANTTWAEAVCINIRVDPAALRPLVPDLFELDTYDGHAFVSLTASRLKDFGVGSLPAALRMNFYQATYRAHVTFTDFRGRKLRGCYFVRSETNSQIMSLTANMLPEFKAHRCGVSPILMVRDGGKWILSVDSGDDPAGKVVLVLDTTHPRDALPATSCFPTLAAAREILADFYDAFSYDPDTGEVFILRIDRGDWHIQLPEIVDHYLGFATHGPFPPGTATLDSVFYFQNTPYRWLPLLTERVRGRR